MLEDDDRPFGASRSYLHTCLLLIAIVSLGQALQEGNGALWGEAIRWLSVSLVALALRVVTPRSEHLNWATRPVAGALAVAGLALQFGTLLSARPGIYLRYSSSIRPEQFLIFVGAAAVLSGAMAMAPRGRRWILGGTAIALYIWVGAWILRASPNPAIDVFVFQKEASEALLAGLNPYRMTFRDIYGPVQSAVFYGPGLSVGGRLQFGFPYLPLTLLLAVPGQAISHDYRYSLLVSVALAAAILCAFTLRHRWGGIAATLLMFTPRSFFILEQGWTEPLGAALLALAVASAARKPKWLFIPLGLLLAVKQYMVLAVPLAVLLVPRGLGWRGVWALAWRAAAVGATVSLPLILWDVGAFVRDAVTLQFHQPFRPDALSYLAWMKAQGWTPLPTGIAFAMAAAAIVVSLVRAGRTPAGFALGVAFTFFTFFALNKQAFANYYFFVLAALCTALAFDGDSPRKLEGASGSS